MRAKVIVLSLALLVGLASLANAQGKLRDQPGYVDFQSMDISGGQEPKIEVTLKGSLLNLAARIASEEEPELASTLLSLEGILVRVYDAEDREPESYIDRLAQTAKDLEDKGWETIVKVRDDGDHVYIAIREGDNSIVGLVILAAEENDEIVLVNIVGTIDLDEIWRVGREFEIDHLDSVRHKRKKSKG
jgi:hypothetical protein